MTATDVIRQRPLQPPAMGHYTTDACSAAMERLTAAINGRPFDLDDACSAAMGP